MKTSRKKVDAVRFADSIETDNRGMVRLLELKPNETLLIRGRRIKASKIPLSIYSLECGHKGKGIAVDVGRVLFCEECSDTKFVTKSWS